MDQFSGSRSQDLKKYSHRLPDIWERFKASTSVALDRAFEQTIKDVHGFEALRYPDRMFAPGGSLAFHFVLTRADLNRSAKDTTPTAASYQLALNEVDQLVREMLQICDLNPKIFLSGRPPKQERLEYLLICNAAWTRSEIEG